MKISKSNLGNIQNIKNNFEKNISQIQTLEEAGQKFVEVMFNEFNESIELLRIFITLDYQNLTPAIKEFANGLSKKANFNLDSTSKILTLLGTVGKNKDWNTRLKSQGHKGIPLASSEFISAIPMMSALLEQLGFDLGWIRGEPEIVSKKIGSMGGTFYVQDASTTKDTKGRLIIAAQDFVKNQNVKSVFGFGGGYYVGGYFLTCICFLNESIPVSTANSFQGLANIFKAATGNLIKDPKKYFVNK